ncbi:MAG: hypothetical protein AVDCRST_MAG85-3975, partial [uncultured Solirubrobacteraceae bacterium]
RVRQGAVRRRPLRARGRQARRQGPQRGAAGRLLPHAPRHQRLRQARQPRRRGAGRQDRQDRPDEAARPVRPAARRLRQHVHVRAPRRARQAPPGTEGVRRAGPRDRGAAEGPQAQAGRERRKAGSAQGGLDVDPVARLAGDARGQGAHVRAPASPGGVEGRRPRPGAPGRDRRGPEAARPARRPDRHAAPARRLEGHRRHGPRPRRAHVAARRPARAVRDPACRPRRAADRSEADPRRLEAPRVDRRLPRQGEEPVLRARRQGAVDRPDPAHEQGRARAARPAQPPHRDLRRRPPGRPRLADRPPRARHARVPRRVGPAPHGDLARVRPLAVHRVGQRLAPRVGQRVRHREDQRHPDHRPPGQGLDHRRRRAPVAHAPGHDAAVADHLPHEVRGALEHVRDGRPPRPHPRRVHADVRDELEGRAPAQHRAASRSVDQADRPPRRDRQPDGAPEAVEGRDNRPAGQGLPPPPRRV